MPDNDNGKRSFSRKVKRELYRIEPGEMCCVRSRFKGLVLFGAALFSKNEIRLVSDNPDVVGCFVELSRLLGIEAEVKQSGGGKYSADARDSVKIAQLLYDLKLLDEGGGILMRAGEIKKMCCKREFLRGAFMGAGAVSDPNKNYALEISAPSRELCGDAARLFDDLGFKLQITARKKKYVAYVKNSEVIEDILALLGACTSQMELINIKIEKEIRNDANRGANGETSNLSRTINASVDQIKAIYQIRDTVGLDALPDDLREIARLRLEHKDLSLTELGRRLNPPLTKSGVNHRLKKIMKLVK